MVSPQTLSKAQRRAVKRLWLRERDESGSLLTYRQFRRRVRVVEYLGCAIVEMWGMTIGIENDGYTHT